MPRDEAEEEREFLADLQIRSGQDLAGWMAAISGQGFTDKNQAIDWLRAQGFPFARASWLERIHTNGGRPIYLDGVQTVAPVIKRIETATEPTSQRPLAPALPPSTAEAVVPEPAAGPDDDRRLEALIAAAKGYRPLYQLLEALIRRAVPEAVMKPRGTYIAFAAPHDFAAVLPTASEIRLGLDLAGRPHDANLVAARIKGAPPNISHMLILKDARQINAELQALVCSAQSTSLSRGG